MNTEFMKLYEEHHEALRRLAYRRANGNHVIAEDALQNTWMILLQKIETLRDPKKVLAWLKSVLRNQIIDMLREQKPSLLPEDIVDEPQPEVKAWNPIDAYMLLAMKIPPMHASTLDAMQEMSKSKKKNKDMAKKLEISESSWVGRRNRLADWIDKEGFEDEDIGRFLRALCVTGWSAEHKNTLDKTRGKQLLLRATVREYMSVPTPKRFRIVKNTRQQASKGYLGILSAALTECLAVEEFIADHFEQLSLAAEYEDEHRWHLDVAQKNRDLATACKSLVANGIGTEAGNVLAKWVYHRCAITELRFSWYDMGERIVGPMLAEEYHKYREWSLALDKIELPFWLPDLAWLDKIEKTPQLRLRGDPNRDSGQ